MKLLFSHLLQPSPFTEGLNVDESSLLEIKSQALKHRLVMLVYSQLQKNCDQIFPENGMIGPFLKDLKSLYLRNAAQVIKQETIQNEITALLKENGIASVIIKGNALADELYHDKYSRSSVDIDILIRKEDVFRADALLSGAGYRGDETLPLRYCLERFHHATYHDEVHSASLEMHWHFGVPYFFNLSSEEIWDELTTSDTGHYRLSPNMTLIMLLVHHHSHSFRELRILVDILWALERLQSRTDWISLARTLQRLGLLKTTLISLSQIRSLQDKPYSHLHSVRALETAIKTIGATRPGLLAEYFGVNLKSDACFSVYRDKFMARFALDGWSKILMAFLRTLLPSPRAVKELYRDRRPGPLPVNYLRFISWRLRDWFRA